MPVSAPDLTGCRRVAAVLDPAASYSKPESIERAVAECLRLAGLDASHAGTPSWNPLRGLVNPGEMVLLKPNWVKADHAKNAKAWPALVTHTTVVEALAKFVFRALAGRGTVIVADAPQTDSSFALLRERLGLDSLAIRFTRQGLDLRVLDLRREEWVDRDGVVVERKPLSGDPAGYTAFDLGGASEFAAHDGAGRYYGADYDDGEVNRRHQGGRHQYLLARTAIQADVVFSLPKLKTHKKTGITASLKNLVGVNGDKNWLPHHTEWSWSAKGDERPHWNWRSWIERAGARGWRNWSRFMDLRNPHRWARRSALSVFGETETVVRSGNWHGNDTCWRMCLDLNKLIFYGNPDGSVRPSDPSSRRRYFVLADAIVAGEGNGPMTPDPIHCGMLLFGQHPASVDAAAAVLMGFDPHRIPLVRQAFRCGEYPLAEWGWRDVQLVSNYEPWSRCLDSIDPDDTFQFEPHFGWRGHIERVNKRRAAS